ncbi:MAG: signal peptidase II [Deltaproteobacteria bacterium]
MLRRSSLTLGLAAFILAADQLSKAWAIGTLRALGRHGVTVIPSCFHFVYAENTSAAFGILQAIPYELRRVVLTGFAVAAILVLVGLVATGRIQRGWTAAATGLILGGAVGNVIDRIRYGFVVDFIDWHVADHYHWPTFNVADSGIVVGVFVLLWISYVVDREKAGQTTGHPAT